MEQLKPGRAPQLTYLTWKSEDYHLACITTVQAGPHIVTTDAPTRIIVNHEKMITINDGSVIIDLPAGPNVIEVVPFPSQPVTVTVDKITPVVLMN